MLGFWLCGLPGFGGTAQAQPAPRAVDLFPLDGISYAYDVNNSGQVVGVSVSGPPSVWHYGDVAVIDAPQGVSSASAINASGQVAVTFNDGSAGRWKNGVVEFVVPPAFPPQSPIDLDRARSAWGINDSGHLVGTARTYLQEHPEPGAPPVTADHAYVSLNGGITDLGVLPGGVFPYQHHSSAEDINNLGQIVGWSESYTPPAPSYLRPRHATLFVGGAPIDLGTLGGVESAALAINNAGEIVGYSMNAANEWRAFSYAGGVMTQIPIPGLSPMAAATARDINDAGDIVGGVQDSNYPYLERAFARIDGQTYDLNQLAAGLLAVGDGPGFVNFNVATAINDLRQIAGYGTYREVAGQTPTFKGFLLDLDAGPPEFKVHDSNRFGGAASPMAGVTVTFIAGEQGIVASAVTDATGAFSLDGMNVEPMDLHDIQLVKGDWKRTYQAVRPQQVLDGTLRLVLPVLLQEKLAAELVKLRDTGLVVLDYDIERAQSLAALRNRLFPEDHAAHQQHDQALARMLAATESMSRIYAVVEPLAKDAGKLLADNLVAFLAVKEASAQVGAAVAAEMAASTLSERVQMFAFNTMVAGLKHTTDVAQKALVQGSQAMLPPWAAELVNQSSASIIATALGVVASGEWQSAKGEGRKKLLENLAKLLGEQVAGRIIASAHVAQTQQDFDLAEVRARGQQGSGTVAEAYAAALAQAIEAEEKADLVMAQSSLIDKTATEFGYVADYADAAGKVPGAQVAAMMSRLIKVLNLGLVVKAVTDDFTTLGDITFEDTPSAAERAFFPGGMGTPAPAPEMAAEVPQAIASSGEASEDPPAAPLPPGFAAELAAFRAAVVASDAGAALTAGENMLALNTTVEQQMEAALLQARSRALSASPVPPALADAYGDLQDAVLTLRAALAELYPAMAGYIVPQLADPGMTPAALLALLDAAAAAITAFDNADAAAQAAGSGITAPALVVTLSHGLIGTPDAGKTQPGPASLRATILNAGGVAAEGFVVTLALEPPAGAVPSFSLTTAAAATVGTLAPGQSVDITWNGIATDVSANGIGCVAAYAITIQTSGARAEGAGGGFEVRSAQSSFADWIAGFSGLGTETGFAEDPDRDGISSGLEKFFGSHPGSTSGLGLRLHSGPGLPILEHTCSADYGRDVTASYEWSPDLANWHPSGTTAGGVRVALEPEVVAGAGTGLKTIQIVPQITGSAERLFYRVNVTPNPPVPPDPAPTAPQITTPPVGLNVNEGQPATFSVTVTGTGPILYQWRKDGVDIVGAIDRTYQIPSSQSSHAGIYTVRIVAPGGQLTSPGAELTVNSGGGGA